MKSQVEAEYGQRTSLIDFKLKQIASRAAGGASAFCPDGFHERSFLTPQKMLKLDHQFDQTFKIPVKSIIKGSENRKRILKQMEYGTHLDSAKSTRPRKVSVSLNILKMQMS